MQIVFAERAPGRIEFGVIYGLIASLALVAGRFLPIHALAPSCAFKALTGLPCPTCGSTRSVVHLSQAHFFSAFAVNPLTTVALLVAVAVLIYSLFALLFRLPAITIVAAEQEKDLIRAAIILVLLFNWLYLFFTL